MNRQEMVKWELVEQAVWLVALAAAVVILVMQAVVAPPAIPVTGAGAQQQGVYEMQAQDLPGFCLDDVQAGGVLKEMGSTY